MLNSSTQSGNKRKLQRMCSWQTTVAAPAHSRAHRKPARGYAGINHDGPGSHRENGGRLYRVDIEDGVSQGTSKMIRRRVQELLWLGDEGDENRADNSGGGEEHARR